MVKPPTWAVLWGTLTQRAFCTPGGLAGGGTTPRLVGSTLHHSASAGGSSSPPSRRDHRRGSASLRNCQPFHMRHTHGLARGEHRSGASRVGGVPSLSSETLPTLVAAGSGHCRARRPNRNQNEPLTAPNKMQAADWPMIGDGGCLLSKRGENPFQIGTGRGWVMEGHQSRGQRAQVSPTASTRKGLEVVSGLELSSARRGGGLHVKRRAED